MGYRDNEYIGCGCSFLLLLFIFVIAPMLEFIEKSESIDYIHVILFCLFIIATITAYIKHKRYKEEQKQRVSLENSLTEERKKTKKLNSTLACLQTQNDKLTKLLNSKSPFKDVAVLTRDCISAIFDNEEHYLRYKSRPAIKSAELVKEIKGKYTQMSEAYLLMQYRYDFLLNMFPELKKYIEDDESALDAMQATSIERFQEEYDRSRDYLSIEEYKKLSVDERNQLAFDRYKERRRRSSWIAGVEYEMYYCYLLREKGFNVIDFGVQKGLNDLGRDIIATKNGDTFIIQCKRWSANKEIHENVICQLFGTTLHYKIVEKENDLFSDPSKIHPVLVTTGVLSETAKEFANKLDVQVLKVKMGEYPMIKCNINNGNKIYHLPFDQQYWRTIIEPEKGEFYAMTVKEATQAGFRRAFKYVIN